MKVSWQPHQVALFGQRGTRLSFVFSQAFFSPFCHLMEFGFPVTVASGLLSWGHLIFSDIIDLTAQTQLYENWTELDDDINVYSQNDDDIGCFIAKLNSFNNWLFCTKELNKHWTFFWLTSSSFASPWTENVRGEVLYRWKV